MNKPKNGISNTTKNITGKSYNHGKNIIETEIQSKTENKGKKPKENGKIKRKNKAE